MLELGSGLSLESITTSELLRDSISFLEKGFRWNSRYSKKLAVFIKTCNGKELPYGYALKSGLNIAGVILTIKQGSISDEDGKRRSVVNLSAWYVTPNYRGSPALAMASAVISLLRGHIVTDYSANQAAQAILTTYGLRSPNYIRYELYIWKRHVWKASNTRNALCMSLRKSDLVDYIGFVPSNKDFNITLMLSKHRRQLIVTGSRARIRRRLFGLSFSVLIWHIHWASDNSLLAECWQQLPILALFRLGCIGVWHDIEQKQSLGTDKPWNLTIISRKRTSPFLISSNYAHEPRMPPAVCSECSIGHLL